MHRPLNLYLSSGEVESCSRVAVLSRVGWPAPQDPDLWERNIAQLVDDGLAALALRSIGNQAPMQDVYNTLEAAATDQALETMLIDGATAPVLAEMQRLGLPFVVIKGPAAARFYPTSSDRPYTDIDVVVPGAMYSQTRQALEGLGLRVGAEASQPWPHVDRWCTEGVSLAREDGAAVDLHHHIPPWRWGRRLTFERLRAKADVISLENVDIPVASAAHHLAISVLHLVSDSSHRKVSMRTMADIVNVAQLGPATAIAEELRWLRIDWLVSEVLDTLPCGVVPVELRSQLRTHGPIIERAILRGLLPLSLSSRHPLSFALRLPVRTMAASKSGCQNTNGAIDGAASTVNPFRAARFQRKRPTT